MNTIQTGIITLIKSGITGKAYPLPQDFNIEEAYPLIARHSIVPLAYTGAVNCGIPKTDATMQQMFAVYIKQMLRSEAQMSAVRDLCAAFDAQGIDYLPLKGCHMKELYPKPELRQMGDADILIREGQYPQAEQILKDLGFTFKSSNPHEHTWLSDALYLELHTHMFSFTLKDFYRYYGDGWKLAAHAKGTAAADAGAAVASLHTFKSPEDEFVYLFTHYAKHYRLGGIGLRHLTDLWVFKRTHPEIDNNKLAAILRDLSLFEFYTNTMDLLAYWFEDPADAKGTSADAGVSAYANAFAKAEFMSDYIFASGNWGSLQSHAVATAVQSIHDSGEQQYSKKKALIRAAFPPLTTMSVRYPILKKHPYLLPACWTARIGVAVFCRQKNIKHQWKTTQHIDTAGIETFQEALDYVGLGFDF